MMDTAMAMTNVGQNKTPELAIESHYVNSSKSYISFNKMRGLLYKIHAYLELIYRKHRQNPQGVSLGTLLARCR
jgi:hypothetical protein